MKPSSGPVIGLEEKSCSSLVETNSDSGLWDDGKKRVKIMRKMSSLKHKMLTAYCSAVIGILAVIVIAVSWQLSDSISHQTKLLSKNMGEQTNRVILGHLKVLKALIENAQKDVRGNTEHISQHPNTYKSMESKQVKELTMFLEAACQRTDTDFALVYDIKGKLQASIPRGANALEAEKVFGLINMQQAISGLKEGNGADKPAEVDFIVRMDAPLLKALEFGDRIGTQSGGIVLVSSGMIPDDFGDPFGVCISGKLLNHFDHPMKQMYEATGSVSAIYLDTLPIAYGGFNEGGKEKVDINLLRIDPEVIKTAFASSGHVNKIFTLAGKTYLTTSAPIKSFNGENIGLMCVGVPEEELIEAQKTIISNSVRTKSVVQRWLFGIGIAALFIFVMVSFVITRSITRPISDAVARLKEGEGDLTIRLETSSRDEVGELARWFNVFIERLQTIIRDIAKDTGTLTKSSAELSEISRQMTVSAEHASGKANTVATAAQEMSSNMSSVAAAAEQASTNTHMIASSAEEMAASIHEIAQNSEKARTITGVAAEQAKSSAARVGELGKAAQEIRKVTETITVISDRTNLLALNATIEAARAGEAGRGFAVVANEIKELARQTAGATGEIRNRIQGIQDSIGGTIADMENVPRVMGEVNEIVSAIAAAVEEQSVTTREIAANVAQASSGIQEVTHNVSQNSSVAVEIAKEISEVNQSANEMTNSSSQVSLSAQELSRVAVQLKGVVEQFRVDP